MGKVIGLVVVLAVGCGEMDGNELDEPPSGDGIEQCRARANRDYQAKAMTHDEFLAAYSACQGHATAADGGAN